MKTHAMLAGLLFIVSSATGQPLDDGLPPKATPAGFKDALASHDVVVVMLASEYFPEPKRVGEAWADERVRSKLSGNLISFEYNPHVIRGGGSPREDQEIVPLLWGNCPGVVAFRDGLVLDQDLPLRTPGEVVEWLNVVSSGHLDAAYARNRYDSTVGEFPKLSHLFLAERLQRLGMTDESGAAFEWLLEVWLKAPMEYPHGADSSTPIGFDTKEWHGYAWSHREWRELAASFLKRDAESRKRVSAIREEYRSKVDEAGVNDDQPVARWLQACLVLPDPDGVERWMLGLRLSKEGRPMANKWFRPVFELLVEQREWATAGRILDRPLGRMAQALMPLQAAQMFTDGPKPDKGLVERARKRSATQLATYYAVLLAAGREHEAQIAAETVMSEFDDSLGYRALLAMALETKQVREVHRQWADIADRDATDEEKLLPKVESALKPPVP